MTEENEQGPPQLPYKRRMFVEYYVQSWNASEAARKAGYGAPENQGPRLLKKAQVQAAVEYRLRQTMMKTDEVLNRFAQQARATIYDFLVINDEGRVTGFNVEALKERGYLVKKISTQETKYGTNFYLELYDGQNALGRIGQYLKLFTDVHELQAPGGQPLELVKIYIPDNGRGRQGSTD